MKARHIIQVSSYYPPHLGGQENAVHDLARQLAIAGHEVEVITSTQGSSQPGSTTENDVEVQRLRGTVFGHAPIMPAFPGVLFRTVRSDSIVHLHIGQAFTPEMVWLIAKLRTMHYVAQLHIDFEPSGPVGILLPLYKQMILKHVLRSASAIIVLNEKTQRTVREIYGYTGNVQVANNGLDETFFALKRPAPATAPPRELHLLFVGRLSKQKNLPALLRALQLTQRKVHLDIVGEGDDEQLVRQLITTYNLPNVVLRGRLSRNEVMAYYQTCDALVMPSLYEAQPLVLLEAMAARIPIIGTNVIGVVDHMKDAGIVVEPTPEGLADGIERYFTEYALLQDMAQQGYERAEKLRWQHTLKNYEALYEEVLGN